MPSWSICRAQCVVAHHGDDPFLIFLKKKREKGFFRTKTDEKDFPLLSFSTLELLEDSFLVEVERDRKPAPISIRELL